MKGHRRSYRTATDAFATCFATTSCLYKGQGNGSLAYSLRRLITFLPGCCVYDGAIFLFSLWRGRQRKNSHFFAVLPQLLLRFWFSCAYTSTSHVGLYAAPIGGPWPFNIFALSLSLSPSLKGEPSVRRFIPLKLSVYASQATHFKLSHPNAFFVDGHLWVCLGSSTASRHKAGTQPRQLLLIILLP